MSFQFSTKDRFMYVILYQWIVSPSINSLFCFHVSPVLITFILASPNLSFLGRAY